MIFFETEIKGAFSISPSPVVDERGSFTRAFCQNEFSEVGLPISFEQMNLSKNPFKLTFRGFHFQLPPFEEGKLMRCVSGKIFDYLIDLRPDSKTYCKWLGMELSAKNGKMLYVPPGCAHAFLTLEDNSDVFYMATASYKPEMERGISFNDPAFGIKYPDEPKHISNKDVGWPHFDPEMHKKELGEIK